MDYFLQSSRLGFRTWRSDDLPLALGLWGDAEVSAWLSGPLSPAAIQARLDLEIRRQQEVGVQYWPIFLVRNGDHVGCAGLRPKAENLLELGYYLKPAYWGAGFATEAATAVVEYAFVTLGAASLFAGHHPANRASQRVLEKLGFERAGEEFYEPSGVIEPTYLLAKSGWRPHPDEHQSTNSATL
ncbi:MAG TPA: GNAT family N-acetyltransferase [Terracidiphilus sp.]|jgi:RimJ/RimL family protein N-acetyltransferase|nr:GNAT family N-acetyltransferase [Terracidiphilus sp.]